MANKLQWWKNKKWLQWLNIAIVVYLLCGIALYLLQDRFLFHPVALKRNSPYHFSAPNREINVAADESSNMNVVQFLTNDSLPKGVVLYFHGNRKNIGWYADYASNFTKNGFEVWMVDYPGFGKSTGRLTEQKLYDDAMQLYIMARSKFPADSIILYGKSLGTGIASWLAARRSCKQLILETPYYSMTSLVQYYLPIYPVNTLLKYKLQLVGWLSHGGVRQPTSFLSAAPAPSHENFPLSVPCPLNCSLDVSMEGLQWATRPQTSASKGESCG